MPPSEGGGGGVINVAAAGGGRIRVQGLYKNEDLLHPWSGYGAVRKQRHPWTCGLRVGSRVYGEVEALEGRGVLVLGPRWWKQRGRTKKVCVCD